MTRQPLKNFDTLFNAQLEVLKSAGNYRNFAELERMAGSFSCAAHHTPQAVTDITVWRSND